MTEPDILTPKEACGCGVVLAVIAGFAVLVFGCAPRTVVIPADREVIPVRQTVSEEATAARRTYVEDDAGATGWYVPDAVLLDLLTEPAE